MALINILIIGTGPVTARPRPSSLRTRQERGPLRSGRCGDWRHATRSNLIEHWIFS